VATARIRRTAVTRAEEAQLIVRRVVSVFRAGGAAGVLRAVVRRLRTPHARLFPAVVPYVQQAVGLEIGGPSPIFAAGGLLPVYPMAARVDNVNFAATTIWEGDIDAGRSFLFHRGKEPGTQFIAEGADLHMIPAGRYGFVLSSHMLEHSANPLRALREWRRVLKPGGCLLLIVPHREGTFDHRRPVTTLAHVLADFERGTTEDDVTHLDEVLALHDASRDPGRHAVSFRERAERNPELRSLHQHVFDTRLVAGVLAEAGFDIVALEPLEPYHVVALARNPGTDGAVGPLAEDALRDILRRSPFRTDREPT
jgi:SAM-dependent methyltransferase